jgi:hypothetical protein
VAPELTFPYGFGRYFGYFKDTADRLGLLDRWYRYRDAAVRDFVVA